MRARDTDRRRLAVLRFLDTTTGIRSCTVAVPGLTGQARAPLNRQRGCRRCAPRRAMKGTASLELAEIAASTSPLPQRSREMLQSLRRLVPFDAAWLAL